MNVLAYGNQDPEKVAAALEEKVREELGANTTIEHWNEQAAGAGVSVGNFMASAARALFGGKEDLMYALTLDVEAQRRFQLRANVNRQGIGCHVGALLYATRFGKHVDGDVTLDDKKPIFAGDPAASAKLNGHKDLMKRLDQLARTHGSIGGLELTIPRHCVIHSQPQGALFTLATLGRSHAMGFKMAIDAKEFVDLANAIEAAL
jgi:hypothetical protein